MKINPKNCTVSIMHIARMTSWSFGHVLHDTANSIQQLSEAYVDVGNFQPVNVIDVVQFAVHFSDTGAIPV